MPVSRLRGGGDAGRIGGRRRLHQPRRAKERGDLDSEGHPPEIGVTYQLPKGETWNRKSKVRATKREFAAFAKTMTWGQ